MTHITTEREKLVVPDGWKLVPIEPTDAMCQTAAIDTGDRITDGPGYASALYGAMLDAAPDPAPAQAVQEPVENAWRTLALQFDAHRMSALAHLRAMVQDPAKHTDVAREFLSAPPAAPLQEPVACKTLCELCVKRGYDFCANAAKTTPIPTPPAQPDRVRELECVIADLKAECKGLRAAKPAELLTDEQIISKAMHLSGLGTSPDVLQFARAIEAASREAASSNRITVGDLTMQKVFTPSGLTNVSNLQAVFDRVELALATPPAQPAPAIPEAVLQEMAEIETCVDEHEDNGAGMIVCHSCGQWASMRWDVGRRFDKPEDIAHSSSCPAMWAKAKLREKNADHGIMKGES